MNIKNIIFDFGGVLIDWNPRYAYKTVFANPEDMEIFLRNVCNDAWNVEQDRGRTLEEGTELLQKKFPEHHELIQLFYDKWEVMLHSDMPETVDILYKVKPNYNLYGLTNWSAETFPIAYERYSFFKEFIGIVVSGAEKLIKPDERIFQVLLDRYNLNASESIFIDDNLNNIKTAQKMGFYVIHFTNAEALKEQLAAWEIM